MTTSAVLGNRPVAVALAGAASIAFSGILYRYAHVSPSTGAFWRCAWAVPPLALLAWLEDRRLGPRPRSARLWAVLAGVFFAADLIFWHYSIEQVGAGLATVLGNLQVVLVGLTAWALLSERPSMRALVSIPIVLVGVVLISGAIGADAYGAHPALGVLYGVLTALMYTGFLLALRHGNQDVRRPAGPLCDATAVSAVGCLAAGLVIGDLDLTPSVAATGWLILLALSSQVLGWLLISLSLPRLPAVLTSILLTLQPVSTVVLAMLLLDESPSVLQLVGAAAILTGLIAVSTAKRETPAAPVAEAA